MLLGHSLLGVHTNWIEVSGIFIDHVRQIPLKIQVTLSVSRTSKLSMSLISQVL